MKKNLSQVKYIQLTQNRIQMSSSRRRNEAKRRIKIIILSDRIDDSKKLT